jgi:hypothetical protein
MAHREFKDPKGRAWQVWDVYPTAPISGLSHRLSEDAAEGWLAFQSGHEKRRFYRPPPEWEAMSAEELSILCRHAVPV